MRRCCHPDRVGDLHQAILSNGVVKTSPGFGDGYHAVAQGGWISTSASQVWRNGTTWLNSLC